MSIDRNKFLMLALSMGLVAGACGPKAAPADPATGDDTTEPTGENGDEPTSECVSYLPSEECMEWDAAGEDCVEYMPSEECESWAE